MSPYLDIAKRIREMQVYCKRFHPETVNGMYDAPNFYPREAVQRDIDWLTSFSVEDQVGILMIMRRAGIGYTLFMRDDIPDSVTWFNEISVPLAKAMGGRMGNVHSGRKRSSHPMKEWK